MTISQCIDDVRAPLGPAIGRLHRVKDDGAVGMKTHPVVRKDGVRRVGFLGVIESNDLDAGSHQCITQAGEFCGGIFLLLLGRVRIPALEPV